MTVQDDYLVPTTTLQAVNVILENIGQSPIASLQNTSTNVDAETALNRLYEATREVLTPGWHFNQEMELQIDQGVDGSITLPANALKIKKIYYSGLGGDDQDLVVRGQKLYDRRGHTFNIGRPVKMDLTVLLPFEDLPESARWYITCVAARRMAAAKLVSSTANRFGVAEEQAAQIKFEQDDAETDQRTLRGNPHIYRMRRR